MLDLILAMLRSVRGWCELCEVGITLATVAAMKSIGAITVKCPTTNVIHALTKENGPETSTELETLNTIRAEIAEVAMCVNKEPLFAIRQLERT